MGESEEQSAGQMARGVRARMLQVRERRRGQEDEGGSQRMRQGARG
jgi:hypothetical protein